MVLTYQHEKVPEQATGSLMRIWLGTETVPA